MNAGAWLTPLEVSAVAAALLGAVLMTRVALRRRTIHFWINLLSSLWLVSTACELLLRALTEQPGTMQTVQVLVRAALSCTLLLVGASLVPFSNRIDRHKGYDALSLATTELENAERLFDSFLNALPWPAFIKNRLGQLLFVNERFSTLSEHSKKELLGTRMEDWLPTRSSNGHKQC